jgi:hypothetical protein
MHDLTMHQLATRADVDTDLQTCTTAGSNDLPLQPPDDARLVEDLHAIGRSIDVQMKAFAAPFTFNVQEEPISNCRRSRCGATAEQAPKEFTHGNLQPACKLPDIARKYVEGPFYVPS